MTVTAFRLQNFMGFEDTRWIELRPITLIFGRNSSGKSALLRALLLLRQSLNSPDGEHPLVFSAEDGFDFGDYQTMVRDNDVKDIDKRQMSFWFECTFGDTAEERREIRNRIKRLHTILSLFTAVHSPAETKCDLRTRRPYRFPRSGSTRSP